LIYTKHKENVEFFLVYIKEAHPTDGWQVPVNNKDGILFKQPKKLEERQEVATTCSAKLDIKFPVLVDGMDNKTNADYAAWPDRLYIIGKDGKVAYKGGPGPGGFRVNEMTSCSA
jgi:hypothetical protein